jgi:hypothetical protein
VILTMTLDLISMWCLALGESSSTALRLPDGFLAHLGFLIPLQKMAIFCYVLSISTLMKTVLTSRPSGSLCTPLMMMLQRSMGATSML